MAETDERAGVIGAYHERLQKEFEHAYVHAIKVRTKGLDPSSEVEIIPAQDMAARVQGIVGPVGIASGIREHGTQRPEVIAYEIAREILDGKYAKTEAERKPERLMEQSIRTAVAILTEGVLVAPTESRDYFGWIIQRPKLSVIRVVQGV